MSWDARIIFALFWAVFVTTPGPNAVNCITNGMTLGFHRALPGVAAILTQAALFLALSALGITALGAKASRSLRRLLSLCFIGYGALLGASALPGRA